LFASRIFKESAFLIALVMPMSTLEEEKPFFR